MSRDEAVSGRQYELRAGPYAVHVASVGASLRALRYHDRDLVVPFAAAELRPAYRGATLAPWPNRVVDGRYRVGGVEHQLPLTEPGRGHALHGLATWLDFEPRRITTHHLTLVATVQPQAGYPWRIDLEVTYEAGADGVTQRLTAINRSAVPAPVGLGPHPYLCVGSGVVDDWVLELPADQVLLVDDRLAPTTLRDVTIDPARFDFRRPRPVGDVEIDHAFTGLVRADDGRATVRLLDASGSGVAMSWDGACPWVQIHTADLPGGTSTPGHRCGLAVEPMTCAPDAFNADRYAHDTGLALVAPGRALSAAWSIGTCDRADGSDAR